MNGEVEEQELSTGRMINAGVDVIKIGGGILRGPDDLLVMAQRISTRAHSLGPPIVVVSALYGMTDDLISMCEGSRDNIGKYIRDKFASFNTKTLRNALDILFLDKERLNSLSRDEVITLGEKFTCIALYDVLLSMGERAQVIDPTGFITLSSQTGDVQCSTTALINSLREGNICIVPGFYCSDSSGKLVTLGRGGSDYTAGLIAGAIGADSLEFWKDVPGIMTADPKIAGDAYTLEEISMEMAMEVSRLGGKVLHHRTLSGIDPLRTKTTVKSWGNDRKTRIVKERADGFAVVYSVRKFSRLTTPDNHHISVETVFPEEQLTAEENEYKLAMAETEHLKTVMCNERSCSPAEENSPALALVSFVHDFRASSLDLMCEFVNELRCRGTEPLYYFVVKEGMSFSVAVPVDHLNRVVAEAHSFGVRKRVFLNVKD